MDPNLEAEIVAREDALLRAVTTNDVALLDDVLHDDLLSMDPTGRPVRKRRTWPTIAPAASTCVAPRRAIVS